MESQVSPLDTWISTASSYINIRLRKPAQIRFHSKRPQATTKVTMRLKPTDSTFLASSQLTMCLKPTDSTFLASSQLTNYKHSGYPCYCTVRVFDIKMQWHMTLEIQVLVWVMHKIVAGGNPRNRNPQPPP
jgi:hypothetical protein